MNPLIGLSSTLEAGQISVTVRTDTAFWIWASARFSEGENVLHQTIESVFRGGVEVHLLTVTEEELKAIVDLVFGFMRGGADEVPAPTKPVKERLLDYEKDFDAIYAAFLHSYGIDLLEETNGKPLVQTMHWWRFLALVNNLPAGSTLVDYYMHYRGMDVSKLPRKTDADKKHVRQIIEIKKQVALDGKRAVKAAPKEPAYARKARELLKEKENVARNDVDDKNGT